MSHDIWVTNREAVIHWLGRMEQELQRIRNLLEDANDEALLEAFTRAQMERDTFLAKPPQRPGPEAAANPEAAGKTLMDMLVGGMVAERMRKIQKLPELAAQAAAEPVAGGEKKRKRTLGERIAEDVRRDLEKLEQKRAAREEKAGNRPEE
jgi:hypothetical protein